MKIYKCDKCLKVISHSLYVNSVVIENIDTFELCKECRNEVVHFIRNKGETQNET